MRSPCAKPECIKKSKLKCSQTCEELAEYQEWLMKHEDRTASPDFSSDTVFPVDPCVGNKYNIY